MSKTDPRIAILVKWLDKQALDSSITDETIWDKMRLSKATFYRMKPKAILQRDKVSQEAQKALEQAQVQQAVEAVKNGLKTKNERILIYQEQIDKSLEELNDEKNKLTVMEKVALRKVIRDLQSEISKIEGDYAPDKREHSLGASFLDFLKETS